MINLVVQPVATDESLTTPMAQILWLHGGTLVDRPPPPIPLLRTPPPGWYGDRLRFFDGRGWTHEVRPIHRPSSVMRVAYEEDPPPRSPTTNGRDAGTVRPMAVGLLGLPPALASEPQPSIGTFDASTPQPSEVGLIALPQVPLSVSTPVPRQAPFVSDVRRGLVAGLETSRFVLLWAGAALAALAAIGFLSSR